MPENVRVVIRAQRGSSPRPSPRDVGAIGCVQADHRLDRVRAFVKIQDGCSFSCAFCVIPLVRGATRSRSADAVLAEIRRRVGAGPPRGRAHRRQPRLLPRSRAPAVARRPDPRRRCDRRPRAAAALVDRGQPRHRRPRSPRCARRRSSRGICTSRCSRATTTSSARWGAATRSGSTASRLEPLDDFNLTTDVIVGFPTEDERAFANTLAAVAAAGITKVHVFPYSPRPGTRTAARRPRSARRSRRTGARACGRPRTRPAARAGRAARRQRRRRPRRPAGARLRRRLHAVARRRAGRRDGARRARSASRDEGVLAVVAA